MKYKYLIVILLLLVSCATQKAELRNMSASEFVYLKQVIDPVTNAIDPRTRYVWGITADKEVNSYIGTYGDDFIIIFTDGTLRSFNQTELQLITAHEVGHRIRGHYSSSAVMNTTSAVIFAAGLFVPSVGLMSPILTPALGGSFSRNQENEADYVSAKYAIEHLHMTVDEYCGFLEKMKSLASHEGGFFSTHPTSDARIEYIRTKFSPEP